MSRWMIWCVGIGAFGVALNFGAARAAAGPDGKGAQYVGTKTCKKCHYDVWESWAKTKMAGCFEVLRPDSELKASKKTGLTDAWIEEIKANKPKGDPKVDPAKDYTRDEACLKCHTTGYGETGGYAIPDPKNKKAKRKAKKSLGTGSQEDDARLRQLRKKVKVGRGVTAGDEKSLMILEGRAKADPSKWKAGDGVGYYAGAATSTKPGSQINRGFRVVSVDPKTKTAVVRQVADTGLTATGGDRDRIGDTTVHVANLVRDKKYTAPRGVGAKPEKPSGRKEPWEMTFSEVWSRHLQEETGPINDRIETIEKKLKDIDPFNPGDFGPRRLDIIKLSPRTDKQRKLIAELNKLQKERHSKRSYEVQLAMATKHSKAIEEAIAAGKPISADVLAEHQEYMGLGEKPGPKSEAKKELWEMTREEYRDAILARSQFELVNMPEWLEAHKKGVADALATGRPVPAEVLKDYPDLAKGAKPAAPPGSSSTASVGTGLTDAERAEIRETLPVGEASPLEAPNRTLKPPTETFGIDLMEASRALRATARYKKLRMFTLGMFRPRGARSKIEMQDIRWTTTMAHELGHAVDYRLNGDHFPRSIKARFPGPVDRPER
ncbi:MAG: multiheme c-type cytochrome, partial [Phycisphaerae bacterium]